METQSATQRMIKDVTNDDVRVQITGRIQKIKEDGHFTLEDGTGKIIVDYKSNNLEVNEGDLVNVIGDLQITVSGEKILTAELIQDMNGLNLAYYKELYEMKKEVLEK